MQTTKSWLKKLKKILENGKASYVHGLTKLILWKLVYYQKLAIDSMQCPSNSKLFFFTYLFLIKKNIVILGLQCDIYKNSYNISQSNWPLPSVYFIYPLPILGIVSTGRFSVYIHVYTVFPPYSPSYNLALYPPLFCWYQSPRQDMFCLPILGFCKQKLNYTFVCLM
jgi:hypothetical protein